MKCCSFHTLMVVHSRSLIRGKVWTVQIHVKPILQICVCVSLRKIATLAKMLVCGAPENQKHAAQCGWICREPFAFELLCFRLELKAQKLTFYFSSTSKSSPQSSCLWHRPLVTVNDYNMWTTACTAIHRIWVGPTQKHEKGMKSAQISLLYFQRCLPHRVSLKLKSVLF